MKPVGGLIPPDPRIHTQFSARYTLRRLLADNDLASIWHGLDSQSGREVRVKLVKPGRDVDAAQMASWIQRVNQLSHLTHPVIVPLRDVGVLEGQPYLISNWVEGQTLAERMTLPVAVPARKAVGWMLEVLDALVLAHSAGQVHSRLHPGNLLIDDVGRLHLLDFAVPIRVTDADAHAAQTRALAPWWPIGHAEAKVRHADADIHAVGMMLYCLLSVRRTPPGEGGDAAGLLPADKAEGSDDELRAIVLAAVAADVDLRYASAQVFRAKLAQWSGLSGANLVPAEPVESGAKDGALERLLRRMHQNEDFPAMTHAVSRIQAMAASDSESVGAVADEILKDVALSNKLLRVVNSAYYARGGGISTISRAVTLIGFNGLRNMAMGLVLLEGMQDKAHADVLTGEFLRALTAASIARELTGSNRDGEETFIGAMFQDLGRLLAMYYFPKEASQVQTLQHASAGKLSEDSASTRVLGLSYAALGLGVAKLWDLPADIRRYMHKPVGEPPARPAADAQDQLRWTALAANQLADTLLQEDSQRRTEQLDAVRKRFARVLGATPTEMQVAMETARSKVVDLAAAMELQTIPGSIAARLLQAQSTAAPNAGETDPDGPASVAMPTLDGACSRNLSIDDKLAAALRDIDKALAQGSALKDVLLMVLVTLQKAVGLSHAVFCMRDPKTDSMIGRFGVGGGVDAILQAFRVPLGAGASDLLQAVCARGADTWIANAATSHLTARLPAWYLQKVRATALLLLPMRLNDKPFALIYAGMLDQVAPTLTERQLASLRLLRDRAQQALRQAR